MLRLAQEDIGRNSLSSAERTLEQAILMNNQIPDAFHLLGYVYSKKGKFKKAILAFERALNLDPFHTEAAIALSSLYNDVGRYKEGASVYVKAKKRLDRTLPGHDPRINQTLALRHYELGLLYMRFERFQEAHHEFAKALNLEPENVSNAVQMAKCLAKAGDKDGAVHFLRKTLETNPKSVDAKIQLGILFHSQQRLKEAHREWQEALTIDPENKSAQMYLSMLEYEPQQRVQ
jgi:tetratricopeptide (TPR) repeat protein